jgi:2-keto-4-pentenoate hydratase/2-oxohepta-3-ene-1,7-dioic acid hydratase in catechol pathway
VRLISFRGDDGGARIGVHAADGAWIDLQAAVRAMAMAGGATGRAAVHLATATMPGDMVAFIESGDLGRSLVERVLEWVAATSPEGVSVDPGTVHRLPPVPKPPLLRDFMAFETHLKNVYPKLGRDIPPAWYELPIYYKGNPQTLGADGDDVRMPRYEDVLDYEFELGLVIGRGGRDIPRESALDHVYGMTIYNDFSARIIQAREMSVGLGPAKGKDFDGSHVFGPCLVTMDDVGDPYDLRMRAWVNDELVCDESTASIHWRFEDLIAHASMSETLYPGEIIGSGTVGNGSGAERGVSLVAGDVVRLEVDRLGVLMNRVVASTT